MTLADLEVLTSNAERVEKAYADAVAVADGDWFNLNSAREQLEMLASLDFRPAEVGAGLKVLDAALGALEKPDREFKQVVLFFGHMIDRKKRKPPRFPSENERDATKKINAKLDEFGVEAGDLGLCGGACGGDLIFAEACLERGMSMEIRIPFDTSTFLEKSVRFAGESWEDRFYDVVENERTRLLVMSEDVGPTPRLRNAHARNNLWQLYAALCRDADELRFLALWDGRKGDGEGGTEFMWNAVKTRTGRVYQIDTKELQPVQAGSDRPARHK
jgi:hypothetical protein